MEKSINANSIFGSPEEIHERGEQYYNEMEERNRVISENKTVTNNKVQKRFTQRGKNFIKRGLAAAGSIFLLSNATGFAIGKVNEYNYQKDIDKINKEVIITGLPLNEEFSKEERSEFTEFMKAVQAYEKLDEKASWSAKEQYERTIIDYMKSGKAYNISKTLIAKKMEKAKLYSEDTQYKKYEKYDTRKPTEVTFVKNLERQGFTISGVDGEFYSVEKLDLLSNKIPENLKLLTEDILNYKSTWELREDCLKDGLTFGEHLETVIGENYLIQDGKMKRVKGEDFTAAKEKYIKKENAKKDATLVRMAKER